MAGEPLITWVNAWIEVALHCFKGSDIIMNNPDNLEVKTEPKVVEAKTQDKEV